MARYAGQTLTEQMIAESTPPARLGDAACPGLILTNGKGRKTWTLRTSVTANGNTTSINAKLGYYPAMSIPAARAAAELARAQILAGDRDVAKEREAKRRQQVANVTGPMTVEKLWERYLRNKLEINRKDKGTVANRIVTKDYDAIKATQTGAYVAIPHHTGKAGAREDQGDMYAGSGSAAIADNARFVLVLERVRERNDLARLSTMVQQDQNAGLCDVLRLSSRRGSIRHKAAEDLYIARHGYLMEVAQAQEMSGEARTIQILAAIAAEVKAGGKPSKNGLYKTLGGNRNKLFAEIDELIECGLVAGSDYERRAGSTETSPQKTISKDGLTTAGWALLKERKEE